MTPFQDIKFLTFVGVVDPGDCVMLSPVERWGVVETTTSLPDCRHHIDPAEFFLGRAMTSLWPSRSGALELSLCRRTMSGLLSYWAGTLDPVAIAPAVAPGLSAWTQCEIDFSMRDEIVLRATNMSETRQPVSFQLSRAGY